MAVNKIEHIGIAVKNMEEATKYYEEVLGLTRYKTETVPDQKVKTAFFKVGETKIELLESTAEDGPVAKFIDKRGEGIHHLAFGVDDVDESLSHAQKQGAKLIDQKGRAGADDMNIGFLHPKSSFGVLTEFCSPRKK